MQPRTYLLVALGAAAALLGIVIATNATVDPYGLTMTPSLAEATGDEGVTRPGAFWRKALQVPSVMPRTIVLGTSRAEFGLAPFPPAFAQAYAPVLNLALGGLSIDQMRLLLIHANAGWPLRTAIIGLDMESFLDDGRTDFDASALRNNPDSEPGYLVRCRLRVSRETLFASIARLLAREPTAAAPVPGNSQGTPSWRISDDVLRLYDGQRGMIWVAEYDNFYARLPYLFPQGVAASRWDADRKRASAMNSFRALLRYARDHDIELRLFVSPVHARYLEWYRLVGWWPLFEAWKRALVGAIEAESRPAPGRTAVVLWDFAGFNAFSTESVPQIGDRATRMSSYRDTSHYSPEVGKQIFERLLGVPAMNTSSLPDTRVTVATIERDLADIRLGAEQYRRSEPDEISDITEMLAYLRRVAKK